MGVENGPITISLDVFYSDRRTASLETVTNFRQLRPTSVKSLLKETAGK